MHRPLLSACYCCIQMHVVHEASPVLGYTSLSPSSGVRYAFDRNTDSNVGVRSVAFMAIVQSSLDTQLYHTIAGMPNLPS